MTDTNGRVPALKGRDLSDATFKVDVHFQIFVLERSGWENKLTIIEVCKYPEESLLLQR